MIWIILWQELNKATIVIHPGRLSLTNNGRVNNYQQLCVFLRRKEYFYFSLEYHLDWIPSFWFDAHSLMIWCLSFVLFLFTISETIGTYLVFSVTRLVARHLPVLGRVQPDRQPVRARGLHPPQHWLPLYHLGLCHSLSRPLAGYSGRYLQS